MIGRANEVKELNRLYARNRAELVAIYGRRRVGKTYLVVVPTATWARQQTSTVISISTPRSILPT